MTTGQPVGAVPHLEVDWHAIDWRRAHREVHRLQMRIVKATQEGRWGKVEALQHLLTHSFSGRALAVKRVTENQGKRTPGVDGEIWNTPDKKASGITRLHQHTYHPQPLRRIYIPKANGKRRPLSIPTMTDRAMQALYLLALDPIAETTSDPNSYGFRLLRSPADAIGACFLMLGKRNSAEWVLEGDIRACFDEISHAWMEERIPIDKGILRKWLRAGYIEKKAFHNIEAGVPQGGIISPCLANLALNGLETQLKQAFPKTKKSSVTKVNLARFADDFVITGSSKELLEQQVLPLTAHFLEERGLTLSLEKTKITHIEDGFDFLGQNIRKYRGKLIIQPSKKNVKTFLEKVRGIIRRNKQASAGQLIEILNPVIRGWTNYHRHVCSKQTFSRVAHEIFQALWRWAKRRHPNKSKRWIKKKYFRKVGNRNWVFEGTIKAKDGRKKKRLFSAAQTLIRRHIKIKGDTNPYDPEWEHYIEQHRSRRMMESLRGQADIIALWKDQGGVCLVCGEPITQEEGGWEEHHIVERARGGSEGLYNRILVHPNCHRQIHSQKLTVAKPRL